MEADIHQKYKDKNFQAIGIDVYNGSASQVQVFKQITGSTYPLCLFGGSLQSSYGVTSEYSVVIDQEGIIRYKESGVAVTQIQNMIENLLASVPVELVSFTGFWENNSVALNWQTASESNNYGFEIERSSDSELFEKVGFVKGSGTIATQKTYQFVDNSVENGHYYYRLKQIDIDGSFSISEIIKIELGLPNTFSLEQNYPNPFSATGGSALGGNPITIFEFSIKQQQQVSFKIYDQSGRLVRNLLDLNMNPGQHELSWNGKNDTGEFVSSGVYFYVLKGKEISQTKKMTLIF